MEPKFTTMFVAGTYQQFNGDNVSFAGAEERYGTKNKYVGGAVSVAANNFEKPYGIIDFKGKIAYDHNGTVDQNIRVRTAFDNKAKYTQLRYSPCSVNVPIAKGTSIYVNPHYTAKYNYESKNWNHAAGCFAGISQDINKNINICAEIQRYNIQDIKNNGGQNWSTNAVLTVKF